LSYSRHCAARWSSECVTFHFTTLCRPLKNWNQAAKNAALWFLKRLERASGGDWWQLDFAFRTVGINFNKTLEATLRTQTGGTRPATPNDTSEVIHMLMAQATLNIFDVCLRLAQLCSVHSSQVALTDLRNYHRRYDGGVQLVYSHIQRLCKGGPLRVFQPSTRRIPRSRTGGASIQHAVDTPRSWCLPVQPCVHIYCGFVAAET
jgi:hypothetical protein